MEREPLLSIVIPVYNASKFLNAALDSLLNQSYTNIEVLIADDASTDNSLEIINSYSDTRIKCFHNPSNLGYLKTCNKLFNLCSGDYITFQDADDVSLPDRLKIVVDELIRTDADICTTSYQIINENGHLLKHSDWNIDYKRVKEDSEYKPYLCGQTIMVKKSLADRAGYYHLYFDRLGGEDYEWFFRMITQYDAKGIHIDQELYAYRSYLSPVKLNYLKSNTYQRKMYLMDLVYYIREHYIRYGEYLLLPENASKIAEVEKEFDAKLSSDPSFMHRQFSRAAINNKLYGSSIKEALKAIACRPLHIANYSNFVYCNYVILRREMSINNFDKDRRL